MAKREVQSPSGLKYVHYDNADEANADDDKDWPDITEVSPDKDSTDTAEEE